MNIVKIKTVKIAKKLNEYCEKQKCKSCGKNVKIIMRKKQKKIWTFSGAPDPLLPRLVLLVKLPQHTLQYLILKLQCLWDQQEEESYSCTQSVIPSPWSPSSSCWVRGEEAAAQETRRTRCLVRECSRLCSGAGADLIWSCTNPSEWSRAPNPSLSKPCSCARSSGAYSWSRLCERRERERIQYSIQEHKLPTYSSINLYH